MSNEMHQIMIFFLFTGNKDFFTFDTTGCQFREIISFTHTLWKNVKFSATQIFFRQINSE